MNTRCESLQDDLKAYLDAELSPARRWAVQWHLARCAACREELRIMSQITEELRAGAEEPLDPALRSRILSTVGAADDEASDSAITRPPTQARWLRMPSLWTAGFVAAAALICVAVVKPPFIRDRGNNPTAQALGHMPPGQGYPLWRSNPTTSSTAVNSVTGPAPAPSAPTRVSAPPAAKAGVSFKAGYSSQDNISAASSAASGGTLAQRRSVLVEPSAGAKRANMAKSTVEQVPATSMDNANDADTLPSSLRRVHKEGKITVEVAKLEERSDSVEQMVKSMGGYVADNSLNTGADGLRTAVITAKVPVQQFETFMAQCGRLGNVVAKNVSGQDITEKFSDVESADQVLGSDLSIKEAQLQEAMRRHRRDNDALWEQRADVRQLRVQAAQMRARLNLLKKISDLATVSVQLQEKSHAAAQGGFMQEMNDTGESALTTFMLAARVPLYMLIWALAYAPIWLPLLLIYRYALRTYSRRTP